MTSDEIGALTIADVESIVERAGAALAAFREARALLGGIEAKPSNTAPTPPEPGRIARVEVAPPPSVFTAAEQAERARLLRNMRGPELPPEIERLEGQQ